MKKRKILVFTSTFPRWEKDTNPPFVYELSKRLTQWFDVVVLAPHYPGAKYFEIMGGMRVYRFRYFIERWEKLSGNGGILPTLKRNFLYYGQVPFFIVAEYLALRKVVKKEKPDIIHAHWIIPQGLVCSIATTVPYVVTTHGGDIYGLRNPFFQMLKRRVVRKAFKTTVVSGAIRTEVSKLDPSSNVAVIPMGVDSKLFSPEKRELTIKKHYGVNGPLLLFVGRLVEKKGVEYLLDALPKLVLKYPNARLLIVGEGPNMPNLKKQVTKLNLTEFVIFCGAIQNKDLPRYYATADIFIGPSVVAKSGDTEGLGLTFVEAGLSGCALVGSRVGGVSDVVTPETGVLVDSRNADAIAVAVDFLLQRKNRKVPSKIAAAIKSKFDLSLIVKQYRSVLS